MIKLISIILGRHISNVISCPHFGKSLFLDFFCFFQYGRKKTNRELAHLETALPKCGHEIRFEILGKNDANWHRGLNIPLSNI